MQLMWLIFILLLIYTICDYQLFAPFRADYGQGRYGYKDTDGKIRILPKYDYADCFHNGLARVGFWGKYGFINKRGKEVIPPKYDEVWSFSSSLAGFKLNGKWGFVDKKGNEYWDMTEDEARQQMQNR